MAFRFDKLTVKSQEAVQDAQQQAENLDSCRVADSLGQIGKL